MLNAPDIIETIHLTSGPCIAVFHRDELGWRPDWIYEGDLRMIRFKDHEWLSLGRVVYPTHATSCERQPDGSLRFFGDHDDVMGVSVSWHVDIQATGDGWFRVSVSMSPSQDMVLCEAMSSFETPYDYAGEERSRTVIGANPATVWNGRERETPPVYAHPAWCYSREEAARATYASHLPLLAHEVIGNGDAEPSRWTCIVADFRNCSLHELYATPTRTVHKGMKGYWDFKRADKRGYKFIVGAGNWMSSYEKDPPYFIPASGMVQVVELQGRLAMPGGRFDKWLLGAWERSYAINGNHGQRPPIADLHDRLGVSWHAAAAWTYRGLLVPGETGISTADKGPVDYLKGTRPLADYCYGPGWRQYLQRGILGLVHYRMCVLGLLERDRMDFYQLQQTLVKHGQHTDIASDNLGKRLRAHGQLATFQTNGIDGPLIDAMQSLAGEVPDLDLGRCIADALTNPDALPGVYVKTVMSQRDAITPETYLLWLPMFEAIASGYERHFWAMGYMPRSKAFISGGQASASRMLVCAEAFALAYQASGERRWAILWQRLINNAIAWGYHTYAGKDLPPDLDMRGLAHACMAGRDQLADIPPMENMHLMQTLSWMDIMPTDLIEPAWLDVLWMGRHTGLSQYPKARTHVRGYDGAHMSFRWYDAQHVGSHAHLCKVAPYFAYENPVDMTLVATYQSLACLPAEVFMGNTIADAGPDLLCLTPRGARQEYAEEKERRVLVYNPKQDAQDGMIRAHFANGQEVMHPISLVGRSFAWATLAV